MGKPPVSEKEPSPQNAPRWPFDPMHPGDHEPVRLPEELERLQKPERGDKA